MVVQEALPSAHSKIELENRDWDDRDWDDRDTVPKESPSRCHRRSSSKQRRTSDPKRQPQARTGRCFGSQVDPTV